MHTVEHPEYGTVTIGDHMPEGRSRRCTTEDGREVILSSTAINKLLRLAKGNTPVAPEEFIYSVKLYLDGIQDGPVRDRTAREVWELADKYLVAPSAE